MALLEALLTGDRDVVPLRVPLRDCVIDCEAVCDALENELALPDVVPDGDLVGVPVGGIVRLADVLPDDVRVPVSVGVSVCDDDEVCEALCAEEACITGAMDGKHKGL